MITILLLFPGVDITLFEDARGPYQVEIREWVFEDGYEVTPALIGLGCPECLGGHWGTELVQPGDRFLYVDRRPGLVLMELHSGGDVRGFTRSIPEPSAISLVLLGLLGLTHRRFGKMLTR